MANDEIKLFLKRFNKHNPRQEVKNAVFLMLVPTETCCRVLMVVEKRKDNCVWGLPGGKIDGRESPWIAAKRELLEETGHVFDKYNWNLRLTCDMLKTRYFIGTYKHKFKILGKKHKSKEIESVGLPRLSQLTSYLYGSNNNITWKKEIWKLRRCMLLALARMTIFPELAPQYDANNLLHSIKMYYLKKSILFEENKKLPTIINKYIQAPQNLNKHEVSVIKTFKENIYPDYYTRQHWCPKYCIDTKNSSNDWFDKKAHLLCVLYLFQYL
jgi:hypothetical protein